MSSRSISVCVITYNPDLGELAQTLQSLDRSLRRCQLEYLVFLVDNSPDRDLAPWLASTVPQLAVTLHSGHGNVGFAQANNQMLDDVGEFHLVLNPDVEMAQEALANAIAFLDANPDCGLLAPYVSGRDGNRQLLCKRFPSVLDLALRGFAPNGIRRLFKRRLSRYQMADIPADQLIWDPPIVSGCFMMFRGKVFKSLNGFDPAYFLYFEDFDLALRTGRISRIAYVPEVRIVHGGGNASRKGAWHILQFAKSAITFYRKFGLKLW